MGRTREGGEKAGGAGEGREGRPVGRLVCGGWWDQRLTLGPNTHTQWWLTFHVLLDLCWCTLQHNMGPGEDPPHSQVALQPPPTPY